VLFTYAPFRHFYANIRFFTPFLGAYIYAFCMSDNLRVSRIKIQEQRRVPCVRIADKENLIILPGALKFKIGQSSQENAMLPKNARSI